MTVAVPVPAAVMAAPLGEAAQLWAGAGWQVFPIVPRGKTPFAAGDFCGRDDDHACGFHCATSDVDQIATWWDEHPDSNIGLSAPDAFVIDEDRLSALREAGIHLPVCPWQVTGRVNGGKHFFLVAPTEWVGLRPGARVRNRLEGVEIKGFNKGYVVAAPSVHASGARYELKLGGYVPECPADVANALTEITLPDTGTTGLDTITVGGYVLPARVAGGGRYEEIVRYTAHLYNRGLSRDEMWSLVEGQLAPRFDPQLPKPELRDRFRRATAAMSERLGEPRSLPEAERRERDEADELGFLSPPAAGEFPADPDPTAFAGLLGECVRDLEPGTDASTIGLLGSVIAFAGAVIPGQTYWQRTNTSSPFVALVGESGLGRKGTAMYRARDAFANVWPDERITENAMIGGLNSGEALVATLYNRRQNNSEAIGLLFEEEYARLLASRGREGSTLDPMMRLAFDGGALENRKIGETKVVMPPYWLPALIGITPSELGRRLEPGALQSGSANRWAYLAVRRREVESDDSPPHFDWEHRQALRDARQHAMRTRNPLVVDPVASRVLSDYAEFCVEQSVGISRDLTRRLHVIALRVSLVHALAERDTTIRVPHVDRALAVTEYARRGLPWVFRSTLGNAIAELIYRHLLEDGPLSNRTITREICRDPQKRVEAIDELIRLRVVERQTTTTSKGRRLTKLVAKPETVAWTDFRHAHVTESHNPESVTSPRHYGDTTVTLGDTSDVSLMSGFSNREGEASDSVTDRAQRAWTNAGHHGDTTVTSQ